MLQPTAAVNHSPLKTIIKLQHVSTTDGSGHFLNGTNGTIVSSTAREFSSGEESQARVSRPTQPHQHKHHHHKRHHHHHHHHHRISLEEEEEDSSNSPQPTPQSPLSPLSSSVNDSMSSPPDLPKLKLSLAPKLEIKMITPMPARPEMKDASVNTVPLCATDVSKDGSAQISPDKKLNNAGSANRSSFLQVLAEDHTSRALVFHAG
ncbi:hypothetical protein TYRP_010069 [Tyrophagus putrescentiae]|nr:hypothetical protein TYRP_010069 [Tyrophagus putrescentiae]